MIKTGLAVRRFKNILLMLTALILIMPTISACSASDNDNKDKAMDTTVNDKSISEQETDGNNDITKQPELSGDSPVRVDIGTEFTTDLNGDSKDDTVYYGFQSVMDNGFEYEMPLLRINGTEYDYKYLEDKFGVYVVSASDIGYYIMDIDTSDACLEIAILDMGPSNDPVTQFFRYDGKDPVYCGYVTDFPDNPTFSASGDGSITASRRLSILQTWWAPATWKLNAEGVLEEQISDIYYPYQYATDESNTNHALSDLELYQEPDKNSASVTVKKGEVIRLTATDNLNWVQITSDDGTKGWFYLHDLDDVILPTGEYKIGDIVTYLNQAD